MPTDPANLDQIISDVIEAEGGSKVTNDPADAGGRTQYGISERFHPEAWADGKVTEEEARAIYRRKYVEAPGFDRVADPGLQHQLVDFGVHSGPYEATRKLQEVLAVTTDGIFGPKTQAALEAADSRRVNNRLAAARIRMIGRIVASKPSQLKFLAGWLNRATEFIDP